MNANVASASDIARERPEWAPWLAVVDASQREMAHASWDRAEVSTVADRHPHAPLLTNASIAIDRAAAQRALAAVLQAAATSSAETLAAVGALRRTPLDPLELIQAAINRDDATLARYARAGGVDAEALAAVVALARAPLLHACARRYPSASGWNRGYCPVCGEWPAFVEIRGVDRNRYLRCADCGGAWASRCLECVYCGTQDHEQLGSLVPEANGTGAAIEACHACRGYLKAFTRLSATPAHAVALTDLATLELDFAAVEHGYSRPRSRACALHTKVTARAG